MFKKSFIVALLLVTGCGDKKVETIENKLTLLPYVVVDKGDLTHKSESVTGTGSIVFNKALGQIDSNNHYRITFSLQPGGSVAIVANSSDKLEKGARVKFTRTPEDNIAVAIETPGGSTDISGKFSGQKATAAVTYAIDVHNAETKTHIVIWKADVKPDKTNFFFNSEEESFESKGKGTGAFWGIVLNKASVTHVAPPAEPAFKE